MIENLNSVAPPFMLHDIIHFKSSQNVGFVEESQQRCYIGVSFRETIISFKPKLQIVSSLVFWILLTNIFPRMDQRYSLVTPKALATRQCRSILVTLNFLSSLWFTYMQLPPFNLLHVEYLCKVHENIWPYWFRSRELMTLLVGMFSLGRFV